MALAREGEVRVKAVWQGEAPARADLLPAAPALFRASRFGLVGLRALVGRWLRRVGLLRPAHRCYAKWIKQRVKARRLEYPARVEPGLFSILTPVCDPPAFALRELARSVLNQDYPEFEWVIVDNGSVKPAVRRLLDGVGRDDRVRLIRLPRNEGIVAGMRAALEQAHHRYVLPVDHDDLIYPDALRVTAAFLQTHGDLPILYSDEDKLAHHGRPAHPLFKPDWDPALFLNCCYVTHLSVIDRRLALDLDAYTDADAEGCPDWDLYCRFVRAGYVPGHIPEILYSWRMHERSTASPNSRAKPYTLDCQRRLLQRELQCRGLSERFELRPNPLYGEAGVWHPVRKPVDAPPLHVFVLKPPAREVGRAVHALEETGYPAMTVEPVMSLAAVRSLCAENFSTDSLIAVLDSELLPVSLDWPWEAVGLFELHEDAAVVGGRITTAEGLVLSAGEIFGQNGLIGSPDAGRHETERGMPFLCQHAVDAVSPRFFVTRAKFLVEALSGHESPLTLSLLHAWLGAAARRRGLRVLYSPHMVARQLTPAVPETWSQQERLEFLRENGDVLGDPPHYSRFLSLRPRRGYRLAPAGEREALVSKLRSLAYSMSPIGNAAQTINRLEA